MEVWENLLLTVMIEVTCYNNNCLLVSSKYQVKSSLNAVSTLIQKYALVFCLLLHLTQSSCDVNFSFRRGRGGMCSLNICNLYSFYAYVLKFIALIGGSIWWQQSVALFFA